MSDFGAARKRLEEQFASGGFDTQQIDDDVRLLLAEVDRLKTAWDDGRAEYRIVWKLVEQLGLLSQGGCPDSRILAEVDRLQAEVLTLRKYGDMALEYQVRAEKAEAELGNEHEAATFWQSKAEKAEAAMQPDLPLGHSYTCWAIGREGYICQLKTGHLTEHSDGDGHSWTG